MSQGGNERLILHTILVFFSLFIVFPSFASAETHDNDANSGTDVPSDTLPIVTLGALPCGELEDIYPVTGPRSGGKEETPPILWNPDAVRHRLRGLALDQKRDAPPGMKMKPKG